MDFQVCVHLFHWIFMLHIPSTFGFPHNRPDSSTILKVSLNTPPTSKSQVPYDAINSRKLPKIYQQLSDKNGAKLENVEKYIKGKVITETVDSIRQTLQLGNKQEFESYLRYLPRNLHKYSSHSKTTETQKVGIGTSLDADAASKQMTHLSDAKATQDESAYTENKTENQARKQSHLGKIRSSPTSHFSKGQKEIYQKDIVPKRSKYRPHKPNVIETKPKDGINFAVMPVESVTSDYKIDNMLLAIGAGIVALGMGIVFGIFGCCCKKQKVETEKDKEEQSAIINTAEEIDKGLPDAPLDLSESSKEEEEEPKSIKDKIKAFENEKKPIIPQPTDVTPQGRIRNSEAFTALAGKQLFIGMSRPPPVTVREEPDENKSKDDSTGDTLASVTDEMSKSDTHEEIPEITLDNTSTHSSTSQPHNPDVVIASDDEDEFADIQRGTKVLKSFQRAKPPRNRSPATRSNRKLRQKSPGNLGRSERDSPDNAFLSPLMSQSLYVESPSEKLDRAKDKSGSVPDNLDKLEPVNISKSIANSNGEILNQSKPKGGSSADMDKNRDLPNGARFKKNKDSPLAKPKYRKKDRESSAESDSRKRISLSELGTKQKGLSSAIDDKDKSEEKQTKTAENENSVKRLSGLPPNVNNIFYLIDPTVKDKCKSVGDVTASNNHSKGKSKDAPYKKDKASKHKPSKDNSAKEEDDVSPKKRERTRSDPARQSKEMENTAL